MAGIIVSAAALAAAARCSSEEPARPALNGVFVKADGTVVGTNWHVLVEVSPLKTPADLLPASITDGGEIDPDGVLMPAADAVAAAEAAPKKQAGAMPKGIVSIVSRGGSPGIHEALSTNLGSTRVQRFHAVDVPFPDYQQAFPGREPKLEISFSLPVLEQMVSTLKLAGIAATEPVKLSLFGPLNAALVSTVNGELQAIRMLVMPMRDPSISVPR